MMQRCTYLAYILPKRPFLTERSLTFPSISVIRSEISLRLSSNFMNCSIAADILSSITSVLKEAQGKEAVAPCFEKLGNIFTESIQCNLIQNYLIYSVSALYNTKLAELNSSVKRTKKALYKVSDVLSTQFLAEYDELIKPFILL